MLVLKVHPRTPCRLSQIKPVGEYDQHKRLKQRSFARYFSQFLRQFNHRKTRALAAVSMLSAAEIQSCTSYLVGISRKYPPKPLSVSVRQTGTQ
jgi:hypothetical protein